MLARTLFSFARSAVSGPLVRIGFRWFWWLIPVRHVSSTSRVLAFRHPRPSWETHILVVPKIGIPNLMSIDDEALPAFTGMLATARALSATLREANAGSPVTFLMNGGEWQDVGQLHGHLTAGPDAPVFHAPAPEDIDALRVRMHPAPERPVHALIEFPPGPFTEDRACEVIHALRNLVRELVPEGEGFALFTDVSVDAHALRVFHLFSGSAKVCVEGDLEECRPDRPKVDRV